MIKSKAEEKILKQGDIEEADMEYLRSLAKIIDCEKILEDASFNPLATIGV